MTYYQCDPTRNKECTKENCYLNGGKCRHTRELNMARTGFFVDDAPVVDRLSHMMEMQKAFQERVDRRFKSIELKERAAFLRDHFVYCDQELQEMLYEIPYFKSWKDYTKMTDSELEAAYAAAKEELIDAWHFFMNLAIGLGMDANEFYEVYLGKHQENIRRQDQGYDHTMKHIGVQK